MKIYIVFITTMIFLCGHTTLFAQAEKVKLSGTISNVTTGEFLPFVVVNIKELNKWTTSDVDGKFTFNEIKKGEYTLTASCLGYKDYEMRMSMYKDIEKYVLRMEMQTLALKEVVVTATSGNNLNSSSIINKTALTHLQASSLPDVMLLLPGSLTLNPSLSNKQKLSIRDVTGKGTTNAFGTALIIDGARVSNDANLQTISTSRFDDDGSTVGSGIDARQVAVDNIESIEVIRGVVSAEYGDLNSGVILVKTKAGKSPLEVRFKTDSQIKQIYAGKGFALLENKGFLNVDADYVQSYNDIRTPAKSYNRLTTQVGYSKVFNPHEKAFSFNVKLKGFMTLDKIKSDPDKQAEEKTKSESREISLNVFGNWMIDKPWLTGLKYMVAGSIGKQYKWDHDQHTTLGTTNTNTMESGEHVASFLPYEFYSDLKIKGKPVYLQAKLSGNVSGKYGIFYNNFILGVEWVTKGNEGKGKSFDPTCPPAQNIRPRSFKDIPYAKEYSGFIEDKLTIGIGKRALDLSAGVRFTKIDTRGTDFDIVVDPRFNARFTFLENRGCKTGWEKLSLRVGWGVQHKMPLLAYLYPDQAYIDKLSFAFKDDANLYGLAIITSNVFETNNPALRIPKSENFEIGMDFKLFGIHASITYFKEKLTQGYDKAGYAIPYQYREYNNNSGLTRPEYIQGEVVENGVPLGFNILNTFAVFMRPVNGTRIDKRGVEYTFDFGKINMIQTSIFVDGAYFHVKNFKNYPDMRYESRNINNEPYPYVGIYAGSTTIGNGILDQRLNTNIRLVTHIPQLRLVFTLGTQCVWMDKQRAVSDYNGKCLAYMKDDDGNIVEGDVQKDDMRKKYINPIAYMDREGVIRPFTHAETQDPVLVHLVKNGNAAYFREYTKDPYFMLNLSMTKEICQYASLSFYANNFTNAKPWRHNKSNGIDMRVNTKIYFGAEISLKF